MAPVHRLLRATPLLGLVLSLCGCLISKAPLIRSTDTPLPVGAHLVQQTEQGGKLVADVSEAPLQLSLRDGWYVASRNGKPVHLFRLGRIDESTWLVMLDQRPLGKHFVYHWAYRRNDLFYLRAADEKDFKAWANQQGIAAGWSESGEDDVEIQDIALLVRATPADIGRVSGPGARSMAFRLLPASAPEPAVAQAQGAGRNATPAPADLCGGRHCLMLDDGRLIYRTEGYETPMWYYEDGRLMPQAERPQ
ncbi:hypothetical protein [Pseudomonas jinjuensis]|uniref:Lipoprotein n=1 Tax=Pseudomonas jinjuensis TaxID=198616 RepID=A0A1H0NEU2_9PSED|nr:hypothetical protein [Pseudomonas jinjuensis]SDO91224.1 hypothetical protein SAMN05216193_11817 [Pseudomonas jinjuensis]